MNVCKPLCININSCKILWFFLDNVFCLELPQLADLIPDYSTALFLWFEHCRIISIDNCEISNFSIGQDHVTQSWIIIQIEIRWSDIHSIKVNYHSIELTQCQSANKASRMICQNVHLDRFNNTRFQCGSQLKIFIINCHDQEIAFDHLVHKANGLLHHHWHHFEVQPNC